jgi:hypothetical protein
MKGGLFEMEENKKESKKDKKARATLRNDLSQDIVDMLKEKNVAKEDWKKIISHAYNLAKK